MLSLVFRSGRRPAFPAAAFLCACGVVLSAAAPAEADPARHAYLSQALNVPDIVEVMRFVLVHLQAKEVEMGYDKIWSIGEE